MRDRAAVAHSAMIAQQTDAQRFPCRLLHFLIERGAHPQAACVDAVRPIFRLLAITLDEPAAHLLHEIANRGIINLGPSRHDAKRPRLGGIGRLARGPTVVHHLLEHVVAPLDGEIGVPRPAVAFGRLWQNGKEGGLVQFEIAHILVEIGTRRGLDAEALPAERNLVEIELEDLLLGQRVLDPAGQDHLLQLARDRIFVADQDVLGHLLRDRRSTLRALAGAHLGNVVDHRARKARIVDAAMRPECLVLRREEGIGQLLGKVDEAELDAPFARIGIDDLPIDSAHDRRQRRLIVEQLFRRGQIARDEQPESGQQKEKGAERIAEQAEPALAPPGLAEPGPGAASLPANAVGRVLAIGRSGFNHAPAFIACPAQGEARSPGPSSRARLSGEIGTDGPRGDLGDVGTPLGRRQHRRFIGIADIA